MKTAVFICPGRGTYNKGELGYLQRHFPDAKLLADFNAMRAENSQENLIDLDRAREFSATRHVRGDNASVLIYAATLGDFLSAGKGEIEIVAVTGNSMGWYSALACGGALTAQAGFGLVNTMSVLMHEASIGGQLIYPFVAEDWAATPARKSELLAVVDEIDTRPGHVLKLSIDLGGMLVLAGNETGLAAFETSVPRVQDRFPMRLPHHAAFHTRLQAPVSKESKNKLPPAMFGQPELPLIDGRGAIWWPGATDTHALWDYTFGHQVTETYNFTHAVRIAAKEFAPDLFIIAVPGTTLGGAVIQSLIQAQWRGMRSRNDFEQLHKQAPLVASMGNGDQQAMAIKGV